MSASDHIFFSYTAAGNLESVQISGQCWQAASKQFTLALESALKKLHPEPAFIEPLAEWTLFKEYWDFRYPFNAEVRCGQCTNYSPDWEHDPVKKFRLKSAQLGGLVVFHCLHCQATIRKKHFKDHICFEFSPDSSATTRG